MDIRNTFLAGKMNLDADTRIIGEGQYREALNIRVANSEGSDVGAIEKSLSNTQLTDLDLGGNVYTLSSLRDEFDEKIYWSVLSDSGCYIIEHEIGNEIDPTKIVLHDSRSGLLSVLGFMPDKRLQMVLIVDSDNDNRLLVFTDNNTQPKCINVERAKTNTDTLGANWFDEEMILLIKKPPLFAPTISLGNTPNVENNIEEKFIRFSYRYKYLDGEYSALSPASEYAFHAKSFDYDFATGSNESMVNAWNQAEIFFNTGSDLVTDVELVFKESGSNTLYLVETFNKEEEGWDGLADPVSYEFTNNKIYRVLPEKELFRLFDNVPLSAQALAVINNRLVFGNYIENHDLIDADEAIVNIDLTVTQTNYFIEENEPTKSLKSNRDYEVAISYVDDYGRMTTPLTSKNNTAYIKNENSINQNKLRVKVANKPPEFAKYYRFFAKQTKGDYETIVPVLFYEDGAYRWVKLENSDKDKVEEGDFLVLKSDSLNDTSLLSYVKVLEITAQEENFITTTSETDELYEESGLYFKIKPDFRMNRDDFSYIEWYNRSVSRKGTTYNSFLGLAPVIESPVYYGTNSTAPSMSSSGVYTGTEDIRYLIEVDAYQRAATAFVSLDSGTSGTVSGITVNGIEIMSGSEDFISDLDTTATNIAANITGFSSTPNYTAVAVGGVITISAVDEGLTPNGFVVFTSVTGLSVHGVNMSGGTNNTFKWSIDNGILWEEESVPVVSGVAYSLIIDPLGTPRDYDVNITFNDTDLSYDTNDSWVVSAKEEMDDYDSGKAYGMFRINDTTPLVVDNTVVLPEENVVETILAGARISFHYDEYGEENVEIKFDKTSSSNYENIEEWFYQEAGIKEIFYAERGESVIWFRRGRPFGFGSSFVQDETQPMMMLIRSKGTQNNKSDGNAKVRATINVFQSQTKIVFETKPVDLNTDVFYEIGQTYAITDGYHIKDIDTDTSQADGVDATITLPLYNCFSWGNGYESYKVKDEFNAKSMKIDTRPSAPVENYRQNKRIASFTWSNVYEQTTNYNAINEFNLSLGNYKDLDDKYGSIQRMVSWNTDLDIWQEDKVHKVYYDKKVIYNQDGSSNLAATNDLLQTVVPYTGEYGISTHPESLAVFGNYVYWADAKRGMFLRKGRSGIEVISNFGMRDWTRDAMTSLTTFILGSYDPYFGQYVVSLNGYTLTFDEKVKGWTSFHSWIPSEMERVNNRFFTFKNGQLFLHNATDNGYNYFYNTTPELPYPSRIKTVFNQEAQIDKLFKTIVTESDKAWDVKVVTNLTNSSITTAEFNNRESRWYSYIRQNEDASSLLGVSQGIGRILSLDGNDVDGYDIDFTDISASVSIGDSFIQINGGNQEEVGVISNVVDNTITIDTILITPVVANFCLAKKDSRTNGASVRGYYMEVELEDNSIGNNELFAVTTNVVKSYL